MVVGFVLVQLEAVSDTPSENKYISPEDAQTSLAEGKGGLSGAISNVVPFGTQIFALFNVFKILMSFSVSGMPFFINTLIMLPLATSIVLVGYQMLRGSSN